MAFERGELVLLAFPFSSGSDVKQRPGLVVLDTGIRTSSWRASRQGPRSPNDVVIRDWTPAGLLAPSVVRLDKLATIERTLVRRSLGRLSAADSSAVREVLRQEFCGP